jgi:hypothetical protein
MDLTPEGVVPEEIDYKATPLIIRSSFTGEHPHS